MLSMRSPQRCRLCNEVLTDLKERGRSREYCNDSHRYAADRQRRNALPAQDFAGELDGVLRTRRRPLRYLSARLEEMGFFIGPATLTEWRHGRRVPRWTEPNRNRLLALERVLETEPGLLVAALHGTVVGEQPVRPIGPALGSTTGDRDPAVLKAKLADRGVTNQGSAVLVEGIHHLRVGPARRPLRADYTCSVAPLRRGVRGYWVILAVDEKSPAQLEPGSGCRVGRRVVEPGPGYHLLAVELVPDDEFLVGRVSALAYRVVNPPGPARTELALPGWGGVVTDAGCRRLGIRLSFHPRQYPVDVWAATWRQRPGRTPVACLDGPAVRHGNDLVRTLEGPRLGMHGVVWRWPGPMEAVPTPEDPR